MADLNEKSLEDLIAGLGDNPTHLKPTHFVMVPYEGESEEDFQARVERARQFMADLAKVKGV